MQSEISSLIILEQNNLRHGNFGGDLLKQDELLTQSFVFLQLIVPFLSKSEKEHRNIENAVF